VRRTSAAGALPRRGRWEPRRAPWHSEKYFEHGAGRSKVRANRTRGRGLGIAGREVQVEARARCRQSGSPQLPGRQRALIHFERQDSQVCGASAASRRSSSRSWYRSAAVDAAEKSAFLPTKQLCRDGPWLTFLQSVQFHALSTSLSAGPSARPRRRARGSNWASGGPACSPPAIVPGGMAKNATTAKNLAPSRRVHCRWCPFIGG